MLLWSERNLLDNGTDRSEREREMEREREREKKRERERDGVKI